MDRSIGIVAILSVLISVQDPLMNLRQGFQTIYRLATGQVPQALPPLRLVVIDQASIKEAGLTNPQPMNWKYLATILDRVASYQPKRLGLDFILDKPNEHRKDKEEIPAIQRSLQQFKQTPLVLASFFEQDTESKVSPEVLTRGLPSITSGYTNMANWHLPILREGDDCVRSCPFPMRLAVSKIPVNPITRFSRGLGQFWLQPIQDFSIPSDQVYQRISANKLGTIDRSVLTNQVVMIVASYKEAGLDDETKDHTTDVPLAIRWGTPLNQKVPQTFTGGEHLAYATHHLMTRHVVIPIPDLWGVLVAGTIAKLWRIRSNRRSRRWVVLLTIFGYGILGLQLYLSAKLLLPFLLPSVTLGLLLVTKFKKVK